MVLRKFLAEFLASVVILSSFVTVPSMAQASDVVSNVEAIGSVEEYAEKNGMTVRQVWYEASKELERSDLPREYREVDGVPIAEYTVSDGGVFALPAPAAFENRVRAGIEGWSIWVEYTPMERQMAANGGVAGIAAGICLAGPVACVVSAVIAAALITYISTKGVCPNNQRLVMYYSYRGAVERAYCGNK